jgi:hypothetical protein
MKLKKVNKEFCMDLLQSHIEYLYDMLAFSTKFLTKDSKQPITPEQGLLLGRLIGSLEEKDIELNKKEIDI